MSQLAFIQNLVQALNQLGVQEFCVCAGSRNAPFVELLSRVHGVKVWWGFEERSMAFFALGRARRLDAPVAVVTTSGTAVAEVLPATIEAKHSGDRLVVISCDRPSRYAGSGAPQTIHQGDLLRSFAEVLSFEPLLHSSFASESLVAAVAKGGPLHLNIHLDEPLIDTELPASGWQVTVPAESIPQPMAMPPVPSPESLHSPHDPTSVVAGDVTSRAHFDEPSMNPPLPKHNSEKRSFEIETLPFDKQEILEALSRAKKPLVLVGPLRPNDAPLVQAVLEKLSWPIWAEAASQLRESKTLAQWLQPWGEHSVRGQGWDLILRIGGVPTGRLWRDLEKNTTPVISFAAQPFWSGLSRYHLMAPLSDLKILLEAKQLHGSAPASFNTGDAQRGSLFAQLRAEFPHSEPAWVHAISEAIPDGSNVYLGNSLPIRFWDWTAAKTKSFAYGYNRGANGIDGQLATFFGWSSPATENWCVVGDLTALYDMAAFWSARALQDRHLRIVVLNNSGGQIFSHLYKNPAYVNFHDLNFKGLADLWGWQHIHLNSPRELRKLFESEANSLKPHCILEIVVDNAETKEFLRHFRAGEAK
jgi:2-succinyl-5-enolpyruvyl-6-hydroxy-3-cyclohexene-1-carboxylate synthase